MVVSLIVVTGECRIIIVTDSEEVMSGLTVSAVFKKRKKVNYIRTWRNNNLSPFPVGHFPVLFT